METTAPYYVQKLKDELVQRQRRSAAYSLRAYARDIGVHPATLSQVFKGKRPLPLKDSQTVVNKLALGPKERTLFLESLYRVKTSIDDIKIDHDTERFMLDESHFNVIAEWEHYAVLEMFDLENPEISVAEIVRRFGLSEMRADVVLNNLITAGLIRHENGKLVRAHTTVRTTEDVKSIALQKSHLETLEMGKTKLEEIEVSLRDFSSMTIAVDPEKLTEAKTVIREFRQKMAALLRDGNKQDVYQLAIQFYPLTQQHNEH